MQNMNFFVGTPTDFPRGAHIVLTRCVIRTVLIHTDDMGPTWELSGSHVVVLLGDSYALIRGTKTGDVSVAI